jgi:hypothetical protein
MNELDHPIYQSFVAPILCHELHTAGCTDQTPFYFKVSEVGLAELHTDAFGEKEEDLEAAEHVMDEVFNVRRVPAYQIKDVEKTLPGELLLIRNEKGYTLVLESIYGIPEQTADRMPDVYAKALLTGLRRRLVQPAIVNHLMATA